MLCFCSEALIQPLMTELPSDVVCERCSFVALTDKNVSSAVEMQEQIDIQHTVAHLKLLGMYGHELNVEGWWERAVKHKTLSILWDICRRLLSLYDVYNLVPPLTPSAVTGFVVKSLRRLLPVFACEMSTDSDVEIALNSDTNRIPK